MNYVKLRGNLINLDNANQILKIYPGYEEFVDAGYITIDSYQIRFYFGEEDYACVTYGQQELQWQNDWDWLNSFAIDRNAAPQRSPDGSNQ